MDSSRQTRAAASGGYGHFEAGGTEYVVTDPATPRPWVNVIANERYGLVVSHTGSGFSFVDNSQLAVVTRWQQELAADSSGKFLYLRDLDTGDVWSAAPAPTWPRHRRYACRHAIGSSSFETEHLDVAVRWTLGVHSTEPAEVWLVEVANLGPTPRRLELVAYLEWNMGVAPSPRREFTKLFLETSFDPANRAVLARSHMWEVPSERWGHWNTSFPYVAALACSGEVAWADGDKAAFVGRCGSLKVPAALGGAPRPGCFGRHGDAIAALATPVALAPGEAARVGYALAVAPDISAGELAVRLAAPDVAAATLADAREGWRRRLAEHRIATPEPTLDPLVNDWARYQAISARLWGRCGYYQQSGAYGFRDQLQDGQVWLTMEPERCRRQVALHAAHQFADGSVYHWWHPLSEQGHVTRMTDDLLWLAFVTLAYVKETGDLTILGDAVRFLDDAHPATLREHVHRAFTRVFTRISPRGLPLIGAGDWNDGLSAVGLQERGESVWLGHFLAGLLADWGELERRLGDTDTAVELGKRRATLVDAINRHGWDGDWYLRGTTDAGESFGSASNREGRIYLNAQTWAILNDVADPARAAACWDAVKRHLVTDAGALLLAPAYSDPVTEIGYITRYAPGLRENGGVYTHAATWAIAAACKMHDAVTVRRLLDAINPATKDPERYWAEPYVLPGNVDGPASPHHGRAGWTWYTGSAAWLHRVVCEWVLGVRPEWDGLRFDPCLPAGWDRAAMVRPYRGAVLRIEIRRDPALGAGEVVASCAGEPLEDAVLRHDPDRGKAHEVVVLVS